MSRKRTYKAACKAVAEKSATPPPRVPERPIAKDAAQSWLEKSNPLVGVSIKTAQAIFDFARQGDTQRLHWLYQEIEAKNPVLSTCIDRRCAAISNYQWKVTARPDADKKLGEEQQAAVIELVSNIENFTELLEHLDSSFFRGFALAQPVWNDDGSLDRIDLHNSWEFLKHEGRLYWNPDCNGFTRASVDCTDAGLIGIERSRAIDYPALAIHIRHAVAERDWGRFLERYALPKPAAVMAPNATNAQRNDYLIAAKAVENGQVSVWPSGSSITDFAGGSRGTDPFSTFIGHQEERIVLLSTGGTLTSLAKSDTGSLAGGAQMEVWKEIVGRDAGVLAQAVMLAIVRPFLEKNFWGRPVAADFELAMPRKMTPQDAANVAATLKQAGWRVKQDELEKAVGFSLEKEEPQPQLPMPSFGNQPSKEEPAAPVEDVSATALNGAQVTSMVTLLQQASQGQIPKDSIMPILKAAFPNVAEETLREIVGPLDHFSAPEAIARAKRVLGRAKDLTNDTPNNSGSESKDLLAAFAKDTGAAAEAVAKLLENPSPEAAAALLEKLPDLMPDDPAMAAILAEAMANEFVKKEETHE